MKDSGLTQLNYCFNCMNRMEEGQTVCPNCGHDNSLIQNPPNALPEGAILAGKFLIGKTLGQGGFGITYLGYDLILMMRVAIKEYFPVGVALRDSHANRVSSFVSASDPDGFRKGCEEFQAEAQTLALFNSPNIVHVRDYFRENGTAYIVMDYVEGNTLTREVAENGGKLPWERVLSLFKPLILELDKLHKKHLIHRDIKPDNLKISVDENGEEHLVLMDFGSARSFVSSQITKTYTAMVTPGYAPLEQYSPKSRQGPFTDVYALCATMYAAITGTVPIIASDRVIGEMKDPTFQDLGIPVPETIENAIFHGLEVLGVDRPQSMQELYDELTKQTVPAETGEEKESESSIPDEEPQQPAEEIEDTTPEEMISPKEEPKQPVINNKAVDSKAFTPPVKKIYWLLPLLLVVLFTGGFFLYRGIRQANKNTSLTQTAVFQRELLEKETQSVLDAEHTKTAQEQMTEQALQKQYLRETETREAMFAAETAQSLNETKAAGIDLTETQAIINAQNTQTVQAALVEQTAQAERQQAQNTQAVMKADLAATAWFAARDNEMRQTQTQTAVNSQNTLEAVEQQTVQAAQTAVMGQTREAQQRQTETQSFFDMKSTQEAFDIAQTGIAVQSEKTRTAWDQTHEASNRMQTEVVQTREAFNATQTKVFEPTATNTLTPTATQTPMPTATNTPSPTVTNTPAPTATNTPQPTAIPLKTGDSFTFGTYEQDNNPNNGSEPIEWQVLAVENRQALLISKYGLDTKEYNETSDDVTWETSTLRKWLNEDFYNNAFSSDEKKRIAEVINENPDNATYGTNGGNSTNDKVFLLSLDEANQYFPSAADRKCNATAYAAAKGAYVDLTQLHGITQWYIHNRNGNGTSWWWLRSPGDLNHKAFVNTDGTINMNGNYAHASNITVRPTLWLDL